MDPRGFEYVTKLVDEINELQRASDLLYQVYLECGGYGEEKLSDDLRRKLNRFFKFDDSE